jgi:hypothetical protein
VRARKSNTAPGGAADLGLPSRAALGGYGSNGAAARPRLALVVRDVISGGASPFASRISCAALGAREALPAPRRVCLAVRNAPVYRAQSGETFYLAERDA